MIVECPDCGSRYRIEDSKIPSSGGRVSCPSCDYAFIVWPGGETAELASADSAGAGAQQSGGSGSPSRDDEPTAVADKSEIRRQVEQSVAEEDEQSTQQDTQQKQGSSRKPEPTGADQSAGAEESEPQQGGVPDFLEDAMEGTEEEGTVEMQNPFLDDDGGMSIPDEFTGDSDKENPSPPGPDRSNPAPPGPESSNPSPPGPGQSNGGAPSIDQGDPNATNPVPLQDRQPGPEATPDSQEPPQTESPASAGPKFGEESQEDSTQEVSDPNSLADTADSEDLFDDDDLFGEPEQNPPGSEPASLQSHSASDPQSEEDAGEELELATNSDGAHDSIDSAPDVPHPTGETEAPRTDELQAGQMPDGIDRQPGQQSGAPSPPDRHSQGGAPRETNRSDGHHVAESQPRSPQNQAPNTQGQQPAAAQAARQQNEARADQRPKSSGEQESVSGVLVAIFVLLLVVLITLVAGALGAFDLRAMLPEAMSDASGRSADDAATAQASPGTEASPETDGEIAPMIRAGRQSLEANRLNDALRHFKTASMVAPSSPKVHRLLARTYRRLDRPDRASAHRLRATRLDVSEEAISEHNRDSAR